MPEAFYFGEGKETGNVQVLEDGVGTNFRDLDRSLYCMSGQSWGSRAEVRFVSFFARSVPYLTSVFNTPVYMVTKEGPDPMAPSRRMPPDQRCALPPDAIRTTRTLTRTTVLQV